jgi:non-specific serine/threonine protein kinase
VRQAYLDGLLADARAALGEATYLSAWAAGEVSTLDEVLSDMPIDEAPIVADPPAVTTPDADSTGPLSRREWEVARLVARGMTNRQIATELIISERTADAHVAKILSKLGFASRAQVAAWFVQQGI